MQIISFPAHYQSVYTNFDISSFSLISCFVKPMLLPCKTYTFAMQNNESYNALVLGRLYKKYVMTKYLQPYGFLFDPEMNRSC